MSTQGIYAIRNTVTGEQYVGCSRKIEQRWQDHRKWLRLGAHSNHDLQDAWSTYGEVAFVFELLQEVRDRNRLYEAEAALIHKLKPTYNRSIPRTPEARERARQASEQNFERIWSHYPVFGTRKVRKRPNAQHVGVGQCPRCGLALRLNYTDSGTHLEPDEAEGGD